MIGKLPNWLKFVSHEMVEIHIEQGWRPLVPNAVMHHHEYGIEMGWFGVDEPPPVPNRVPAASQESITNERDRTRAGT